MSPGYVTTFALRGISMKGAISLQEWQANQGSSKPKAKSQTDGWVREQPCHICGKMLKGAYGFTDIGKIVWSCSSSCEKGVQSLRREFYASLFDRNLRTTKGG